MLGSGGGPGRLDGASRRVERGGVGSGWAGTAACFSYTRENPDVFWYSTCQQGPVCGIRMAFYSGCTATAFLGCLPNVYEDVSS